MDEKLVATPLGRVSLVPKGAYEPSAAYERLDLVQYEGSGYIALKDVTGVAPFDGDTWMLLFKSGSGGGGGSGPSGSVTADTATDLTGLLMGKDGKVAAAKAGEDYVAGVYGKAKGLEADKYLNINGALGLLDSDEEPYGDTPFEGVIVHGYYGDRSNNKSYIKLEGSLADEPPVLRGVEAPEQDLDAANKRYVDEAIRQAVLESWNGSY